MPDIDIIVVGAGIVGTSTALWLQLRGHKVLLIDPAPPGSGTSSGNACTIATYACIPVNSPSVLTGLFGLMTNPDSPLSISYAHALRNPRWILSFLANCRATRSREIAGHLASILSHSDAGLNPLIEAAQAKDLVVNRGQITVWSTTNGATADLPSLALRKSFGIPFTELTGDEVRQMEPGLTLPIEKGVHYPDARHIRDPEELVRRFQAKFTALGGQTLVARVNATSADAEGVTVTAGDAVIRASRVVIAAGAFSKQINGSGAERLPLGVERGYHVLYAGEAHRITRPVGWAEGGFYAVPMAKGLRLAGTVEIAAIDAPKNKGRIDHIIRKGAEMFANLPAPTSDWLGYRPSMPDALPVIGQSAVSDRIIHAFGHQHLGLTLGGITGRIVADIAEGLQPNLEIGAFRPQRRYAAR
jgi:glycine/D-amino acid oxidase-like deaminating enzyme